MHKVILYYKYTGTGHPNYYLDSDEQLEVVDQNGNVTNICAKDAKNTRASFSIDVKKIMDNNNNFNEDWVRKGYAFTMKTDQNKGKQIKVPKKEAELRELFGVTDPKKASFWTHEYDQIDLDTITTDLDKLSFLRGVFSAIGRIKPNSYISASWDFLNKKYSSTIVYKFLEILGEEDVIIEYNGASIFFQSRDQIYKFITRIGFIQKSKLEAAITLYRQRIRVVTNVIEIKDPDYLMLDYVCYMGEKTDYNDKLASTYNINVIDPKTGRTPLLNVLLKDKHHSCYPVAWLLKNNADTSIVPKNKKHTFDLLMSEYLKKSLYYKYNSSLFDILYLIYDKSICTKFFFKNVFSLSIKDFLQSDCIDTSIILNTFLTTRCVRLDPDILDKIIKMSTENLEEIMDKLLNMIMVSIDNQKDKPFHYGENYRRCRDIGNYIFVFNKLKQYTEPNADVVTKINQMLMDYKFGYFATTSHKLYQL